jgi:hypothetical protein
MEARAAELTKNAPLVVSVSYADPGKHECAWCDCAEPHNGGCATWCREDAFYVVQLRIRDRRPRGYPVCQRHADGCMDYVRSAIDGPINTIGVPIRDDD